MMKDKILFVAISLVIALTLASCSERTDPDKLWGGGSHGPGTGPQEGSVSFINVNGDYGDIEITFLLDPPVKSSRNVLLEYRGACAGENWRVAKVGGSTEQLLPGQHTVTWWSWEQEAGCAGEVTLRLTTNAGEQDEAQPFILNNTRSGLSGFHETPLVDQGIQDEEAEVFNRALDVLLADDAVDFVATRVGDTYEVYAARGTVFFQRETSHQGYRYTVEYVDGVNPIERQDHDWLPTYGEELAGGDNPNDVDIRKQGYKQGDERLSFIEPENDSYPFAYERIAAYFDNPDSADFQINLKGYAHAYNGGDLAAHGSMNIVQSRCPLIFWGKGVKPGILDGVYRQTDVAPTVARLLGMPTTFGVDERGIWTHDVYLQWQDGHVIEEVLNGEISSHVMILVLDGMNFTELQQQLLTRYNELPNLARLALEGAVSRYGSTTNWPSVTYPSHNVLGSSIYSGHHGLVDNAFYYRDRDDVVKPVSEAVFTEQYWNPEGPGESLHQAIQRVFGEWNRLWGTGAVTASLFDPSVVGAPKADTEFRDLTRMSPFPPFGREWPWNLPWPDFLVGSSSAYFEQWGMVLAMVEMYHLFDNGVTPNPTYVILNYIATDGGGHENGPHGDDMKRIVKHADDNLGVLFEWLDLWGIADDFTLILTSDHGMQLGDPSRSNWPIDTLDDAGIKSAPDTYLGVYLKIPVAEFEPSRLEAEQENWVTVRVADEDNNRPIAGALVKADDGVTYREAITDDQGLATLVIAPVRDVYVNVSHDKFTDRDFWLPLQ